MNLPFSTMKSLQLLLATVVFVPVTLLAQVPQATRPSTIPIQRSEGIDAAATASLKHFDLDFPGGTPREFVAAISKAMGRPLNVVIPESNADVPIMPIKVSNVTVPELFRAIQSA